jgi:phospholipid N-methyltransferase|tara:strand:+ start:1145 stop:1435 length:291 start_codon:yes stop_codon:yes gene_type:complete
MGYKKEKADGKTSAEVVKAAVRAAPMVPAVTDAGGNIVEPEVPAVRAVEAVVEITIGQAPEVRETTLTLAQTNYDNSVRKMEDAKAMLDDVKQALK